MVFLILAAQYERWSLPFSVLLALPFGMFGALAAVYAARPDQRRLLPDRPGDAARPRGEERDPDRRVRRAEARTRACRPSAAALEAARLRFRPILMTSLAFILGVLPLALSTGAGAGARRSVGTGVMGGMLAATFLAIFFVPLFFKLLDRPAPRREALDRRHRGGDRAGEAQADEAGAMRRRVPLTAARRCLALARGLRGRARLQAARGRAARRLEGSAAQAARNGGDWWRIYGDPALDRLVDEAFAHNTDLLRGGRARGRGARAGSRRPSAIYPAVDAPARAQPHALVGRRPVCCRPGVPPSATSTARRSTCPTRWTSGAGCATRRRPRAPICWRPRRRARRCASRSQPTWCKAYFALRALDAQVAATRRTLALRRKAWGCSKSASSAA